MSERRRRFEVQALPHLDAAYNLARWLSRSPADADDIVQDAILRAYRSFDGVCGDDIRPWLLTIVRNCWRNYARGSIRRGHVALVHDGTDPADDAPDPETEAVSAGEGRRLRTIIAGLPDGFREALVLREMEDMSYRDIAAIINAPIGTVMSRLARARAMLKAQWTVEADHELR